MQERKLSSLYVPVSIEDAAVHGSIEQLIQRLGQRNLNVFLGILIL